MGTVWQDFRFGVRMLKRSPGFTAIALITLALGIGANTIMFSMVDTLLWQPPHVKHPRQLVDCRSWLRAGSGYQPFSYSEYTELREHNPVFTDLMGYLVEWVTLEQGDIAKRVFLLAVSPDYFSGLGVSPARGRGFLAEEERWGTEAVAVLSHQCWTRAGADPEIIGKQVYVNGQPFEVVGVMPEGFSGTALVGPELWVPLGACGALERRNRVAAAVSSSSPHYPELTLVGRLKSGLSLAAAEAQLQALAAQLEKNHAERWKDRRFQLARPSRITVWSPPNESSLLSLISVTLMGVSAVVLLIACLNLANMHLAQGLSRQREVTIRLAIGSGRARIVRQLLVESLLLALLGGVLGLVLAYWGAKVLTVWLGALRFPVQLDLALAVRLNPRVLLGTVAFCGLAAVLSGLRPALRLSRRDIIRDLKDAPGGARRLGGKRLWGAPRRLSAAVQIALSVVLVMAATLFTHSTLKSVEATPGYSLDSKLLVEVDPRNAGAGRAETHRLCEAVIDRLRALPAVQAVSLSASPPFYGFNWDAGAVTEYGAAAKTDVPTRRRTVDAVYIEGDYFQSMGLPLLQGRHFGPVDHAMDTATPVIIDEPLARRLRPEGNALGCLIQWAGSDSPSEVIGIVPGVLRSPLQEETRPHVYAPLHEDHELFGSAGPPMYLLVRVASLAPAAEAGLLGRIPGEVHKVDRQILVLSATTLRDYHRQSALMWLTRTVTGLALAFGAMALFLAALGIYGVKAYLVASRTPEIGIRMALGATRQGILIYMLREGAALTLVGLSIGLLLALAAGTVMRGMIYGVSPTDPVSLAVTIVLLGAVSLLASYIPARRAARTDPIAALRCE